MTFSKFWLFLYTCFALSWGAVGTSVSKLTSDTKEYQCFEQANLLLPKSGDFSNTIQKNHYMPFQSTPYGASLQAPGWAGNYLFDSPVENGGWSSTGIYEFTLNNSLQVGMSKSTNRLWAQVRGGIPALFLSKVEGKTPTPGDFTTGAQILPFDASSGVVGDESTSLYHFGLYARYSQSVSIMGKFIYVFQFSNLKHVSSGNRLDAQIVIWPDGLVQTYFKSDNAITQMSGHSIIWDGFYEYQMDLQPIFKQKSTELRIVENGQLRTNWLSFSEKLRDSQIWFTKANPLFLRSTYSQQNNQSLDVTFCGMNAFHMLAWDFSRNFIAQNIVEKVTMDYSVKSHGTATSMLNRTDASILLGWAEEENSDASWTPSKTILKLSNAILDTRQQVELKREYTGPGTSSNQNLLATKFAVQSWGAEEETADFLPLTLSIHEVTIHLDGFPSVWFNPYKEHKLSVSDQKIAEGTTLRLELDAKKFILPNQTNNEGWTWSAELIEKGIPYQIHLIQQPKPLPARLEAIPSDLNWNGSFQIRLKAQKQGLASLEQIVTIVVSPVADAPIFSSVFPQRLETNVNQEFSSIAFYQGAYVTDPESTPAELRYQFITEPAIEHSFDAKTGLLRLQPARGVEGSFTLKVIVTDPSGLSAEKQIPLLVYPTRFAVVPKSMTLYQQSSTGILQGSFKTIRNRDQQVGILSNRFRLSDGTTVEVTMGETQASVLNGSQWSEATQTFSIPANASVFYASGLVKGTLQSVLESQKTVTLQGFALHQGETEAISFGPVAIKYKGPSGTLSITNQSPQGNSSLWIQPYQIGNFAFAEKVDKISLQVQYSIDDKLYQDIIPVPLSVLSDQSVSFRYPTDESKSLHHSTDYTYTMVAYDFMGNKTTLVKTMRTPSDKHTVSGVVLGRFPETLRLQLGSHTLDLYAGQTSFQFTNIEDGTYNLTGSGPGFTLLPSQQTIVVNRKNVTDLQVKITPADFFIAGSEKVRQLSPSGDLQFRCIVNGILVDEQPYRLHFKGMNAIGSAQSLTVEIESQWLKSSRTASGYTEWVITIPANHMRDLLYPGAPMTNDFRYIASSLETKTSNYPEGYRSALWTYPSNSQLRVAQVFAPPVVRNSEVSAVGNSLDLDLEPQFFTQGNALQWDLTPVNPELAAEAQNLVLQKYALQYSTPALYTTEDDNPAFSYHLIPTEWKNADVAPVLDWNAPARWLPATTSNQREAMAWVGLIGTSSPMRWPVFVENRGTYKMWLYVEPLSGGVPSFANFCLRMQDSRKETASNAVCQSVTNISSPQWIRIGSLDNSNLSQENDSLWVELDPKSTRNVLVGAIAMEHGIPFDIVPSLSMVPTSQQIPLRSVFSTTQLLPSTAYNSCFTLMDSRGNQSSPQCREVSTDAKGIPYYAGLYQQSGNGDFVAVLDASLAQAKLQQNFRLKSAGANLPWRPWAKELWTLTKPASSQDSALATGAQIRAQASSGSMSSFLMNYSIYKNKPISACFQSGFMPQEDWNGWKPSFHWSSGCNYYRYQSSFWPSDNALMKQPVRMSLQYNAVSKANLIVNSHAIEPHRIPLTVAIPEGVNTASGQTHIQWTPGSNCEPTSSRVLQYGSIYPVDNGAAIVPSYRYSWSSSVGMPALGQSIRHQWVDFTTGLGGGFAPAFTGIEYDLPLGSSAPHAPRLSMAMHFKQAGDYVLWAKPMGQITSQNQDFYWGFDSVVIAKQRLLQTSSYDVGSWQKLESQVLTVSTSGVHTIDLYMAQDGIALAGIAVLPIDSIPPENLALASKGTLGWNHEIALEDLHSDQNIVVSVSSTDRFGNLSPISQQTFRTKKLPLPLPDANILIANIHNGYLLDQTSTQALVAWESSSTEQNDVPDNAEILWVKIAQGQEMALVLPEPTETTPTSRSFVLNELLSTNEGEYYELRVRLYKGTGADLRYGDWTSYRFGVKQAGVPIQLSNTTVALGNASKAFQGEFVRGEMTDVQQGIATGEFRVVFDANSNIQSLGSDLFLTGVKFKVTGAGPYDFLQIVDPGQVIAQKCTGDICQKTPVWQGRFGKFIIRSNPDQLVFENGLLKSKTGTAGAQALSILDDTGVRRPLQSLLLGQNGVQNELEVSGERFVLRNIIPTPNSKVESFHIEGCRTYLKSEYKTASQSWLYTVTAAGDLSEPNPDPDCAQPGPVLDFTLLHPSTDKEAYHYHRGLNQALVLEYESLSNMQAYRFANAQFTDTIQGFADSVFYDSYRMVLRKIVFNPQGAKVLDLDVYLAPNLQNTEQTVFVDSLAGAWIQGQNKINEGRLHLFGSAVNSKVQDLVHTRTLDSQVTTSYTYHSPGGWNLQSNALGEVFIQPIITSLPVSLTIQNQIPLWDTPKSVEIPLQSLRFSATGWDTLFGLSDQTLKYGVITFVGKLKIASTQNDYQLEWFPTKTRIDSNTTSLELDLSALELRPDLRLSKLRAFPQSMPPLQMTVINAPMGFLNVYGTEYALEDFNGIPAIRMGKATVNIRDMRDADLNSKQLPLPVGPASTDLVDALVLDGKGNSLVLQARFDMRSKESAKLNVAESELGLVQMEELQLKMGKEGSSTRYRLQVQKGELKLGEYLQSLGWKDQVVALDVLGISILFNPSNLVGIDMQLDTLRTALQGSPRTMPISLADLKSGASSTDPILALHTGERPITLNYPSGTNRNAFDLQLQDLGLEFTEKFPVHGLRNTQLLLNQLDLQISPQGSPKFKVVKTDFAAQKSFDRLVLLDPSFLGPDYADPKKVLGFTHVVLKAEAKSENSDWEGAFSLGTKEGSQALLLGKSVSFTDCSLFNPKTPDLIRIGWDGSVKTQFCVDINDTIPLYREDGDLLVAFAGAADVISEADNKITRRKDIKFEFKAGVTDDDGLSFEVEATGDFIFQDPKNKYPQTLGKLAQDWSGQMRMLRQTGTIRVDKDGVTPLYFQVLSDKGLSKNADESLKWGIGAIDLKLGQMALTYWRGDDNSCTTAPTSAPDWDPKNTAKCVLISMNNEVKFNLFDQCKAEGLTLTPTLRKNFAQPGGLKFTLEKSTADLKAECEWAGFQLNLDQPEFARQIDGKETWGLFANRVQLTANRPEVYTLVKADEPIWIRVNDFQFYAVDGKPEFKGTWVFGPNNAWDQHFKINLLGVGLSGTPDFESLFTGYVMEKDTLYGFHVRDITVETPNMLGNVKVPLGVGILFNATYPFIHPTTQEFKGISFSAPLKLSSAVTGEIKLGLNNRTITVGDQSKSQWVLSGMGRVVIPDFVKEAQVDLSLVKPDKINVTGIEQGRVMVKLEGGSRIPLGTTGLYITGLMGGVYDGYGQPTLAGSCKVGQLPPGLKAEMSVYLEDDSKRILNGEVGVWVQMNQLNFGIDGKLKLSELIDAKICAALSNGVFRSKASVTLDKALYVRGDFQLDVWSEKGKKNVAASAEATVGISKGSIYKSRWFKIPPGRLTVGSTFTNFGRFTNGKNGFTTGVKVLGKKYGVGMVGGGFKVGGLGSYTLASPPTGNSPVIASETQIFIPDNEYVILPNEALSIVITSSQLPWNPQLTVTALDPLKTEFEILEQSVEENRAYLLVRFLQETSIRKDIQITANAPMNGASLAVLESYITRHLLSPEITSAQFGTNAEGQLIASSIYKSYNGYKWQKETINGSCQLNEPIIVARRAVENSQTGRVVLEVPEKADFQYDLNLDFGFGDSEEQSQTHKKSFDIFVGPKVTNWDDTLWQIVPASAFQQGAKSYFDLDCVRPSEDQSSLNLNQCTMSDIPFQKGVYEFAFSSRKWSYPLKSDQTCEFEDKDNIVLTTNLDGTVLPYQKDGVPFRHILEPQKIELKAQAIDLQVNTSAWASNWKKQDESRQIRMTWIDPNGNSGHVHGYTVRYYPTGYPEDAKTVHVGLVNSYDILLPSSSDYSMESSANTQPNQCNSNAVCTAWLGNQFVVSVIPEQQMRMLMDDNTERVFYLPVVSTIDLSAQRQVTLGTLTTSVPSVTLAVDTNATVWKIPRNQTASLPLAYTVSQFAGDHNKVDFMGRWVNSLGEKVENTSNASVFFSSDHFVEDYLSVVSAEKYDVRLNVSSGHRSAKCRELVTRKPIYRGSTDQFLKESEAYFLEQALQSYNPNAPVIFDPITGEISNTNDPSMGRQQVPRGTYMVDGVLYMPDICRDSWRNQEDSLYLEPTPYGRHKLEIAALNRNKREEPSVGSFTSPKLKLEVEVLPPQVDMGRLSNQMLINKVNNALCFEVSRDLDWNVQSSRFSGPFLRFEDTTNQTNTLIQQIRLIPSDTTAEMCDGSPESSIDPLKSVSPKSYRIHLDTLIKANNVTSVRDLSIRIVYQDMNTKEMVSGRAESAYLIPSNTFACPSESEVDSIKDANEDNDQTKYLMEYIGTSSQQLFTEGVVRFLFSEIHNLHPLEWGVDVYDNPQEAPIISFTPNMTDWYKYWGIDENGFFYKPSISDMSKLTKNKSYTFALRNRLENEHNCDSVTSEIKVIDPPLYHIGQKQGSSIEQTRFWVEGLRDGDQAYYTLQSDKDEYRFKLINRDTISVQQSVPVTVRIKPEGFAPLEFVEISAFVKNPNDELVLATQNGLLKSNQSLQLGDVVRVIARSSDSTSFNPSLFEDWAFTCEYLGNQIEQCEKLTIDAHSTGDLKARLDVKMNGVWYRIDDKKWTPNYKIEPPSAVTNLDCDQLPEGVVLRDYPYLVRVFENMDSAKAKGILSQKEVHFRDENGIEYASETEYMSEYGNALAWVRIPEISKSNCPVIGIYSGQGQRTKEASEVWNHFFTGIWHFSKKGDQWVARSDTATPGFDSSLVDSKNGIILDSNQIDLTSGAFARGIRPTNATSYPKSNLLLNQEMSEFTWSTWFQTISADSIPVEGITLFGLKSLNKDLYQLKIFSDGSLQYQFGDTVLQTKPSMISHSVWNHLAFTVEDGAPSKMTVYINGTPLIQLTAVYEGFVDLGSTWNQFTLPQVQSGVVVLDEIRFAQKAFDPDWIHMDYLTQRLNKYASRSCDASNRSVSITKGNCDAQFDIVCDLQENDPVYSDRNHKFTFLPENMRGATHIRSAFTYQGRSEEDFLCFTSAQHATAYLLQQDSLPLPIGMEQWTKTNQIVTMRKEGINLVTEQVLDSFLVDSGEVQMAYASDINPDALQYFTVWSLPIEPGSMSLPGPGQASYPYSLLLVADSMPSCNETNNRNLAHFREHGWRNGQIFVYGTDQILSAPKWLDGSSFLVRQSNQTSVEKLKINNCTAFDIIIAVNRSAVLGVPAGWIQVGERNLHAGTTEKSFEFDLYQRRFSAGEFSLDELWPGLEKKGSLQWLLWVKSVPSDDLLKTDQIPTNFSQDTSHNSTGGNQLNNSDRVVVSDGQLADKPFLVFHFDYPVRARVALDDAMIISRQWLSKQGWVQTADHWMRNGKKLLVYRKDFTAEQNTVIVPTPALDGATVDHQAWEFFVQRLAEEVQGYALHDLELRSLASTVVKSNNFTITSANFVSLFGHAAGQNYGITLQRNTDIQPTVRRVLAADMQGSPVQKIVDGQVTFISSTQGLAELLPTHLIREAMNVNVIASEARGSYKLTLQNQSDNEVRSNFYAVLFEDRNGNTVFDNGIDQFLGQSYIPGMKANTENSIYIRAEGSIMHPGSRLWIMVDPDQWIAEGNKLDNVLRETISCVDSRLPISLMANDTANISEPFRGTMSMIAVVQGNIYYLNRLEEHWVVYDTSWVEQLRLPAMSDSIALVDLDWDEIPELLVDQSIYSWSGELLMDMNHYETGTIQKKFDLNMDGYLDSIDQLDQNKVLISGRDGQVLSYLDLRSVVQNSKLTSCTDVGLSKPFAIQSEDGLHYQVRVGNEGSLSIPLGTKVHAETMDSDSNWVLLSEKSIPTVLPPGGWVDLEFGLLNILQDIRFRIIMSTEFSETQIEINRDNNSILLNGN